MNQNQSSKGRYFTGLVIVALTTLFVVTPALAQRGGGGPEAMKARMTQQIDGAIEALALEGVKADTVRSILQSGVDKQMAMMGNAQGGDRAAMRDKMAAVDTEVLTQLEGVLTAEQIVAYKKYKESQQMRRGGGGRGNGGGNGSGQ